MTKDDEHNALRRDLEAMSHADLVNWALTISWGHDQLTRLLAIIPECPQHGQCIPHAIEWVILHNEAYQVQPVVTATALDPALLATDTLAVNRQFEQDGD